MKLGGEDGGASGDCSSKRKILRERHLFDKKTGDQGKLKVRRNEVR